MGEGREGLSLQGLAERLEALERENERMRKENAELRGEIATLKGRGGAIEEPARIQKPEGAREERVSRKALLAKAGAAAVAVAAAGTLLSPREAKADTVEGTGTPGVRGIGTDGTPGVIGQLEDGVFAGWGVAGYGRGEGNAGVYGYNADTGGYGVDGYGPTGVHGVSSQGGSSGVYGTHNSASHGYGVKGEGKGSGYAGVIGTNSDGGGYGGTFEGGRAQLKLKPKTTQGRPTSGQHAKGEIYLDSAGTLFVCTKGGTPGTWGKVTTTSA
jgi:hypothetical protein